MKLTVGELFAGIGGFGLGLEQAGFEVAWQVEIDEDCLNVLRKHWPNVPKFRDIRDCGRGNLQPVDVVVGGPPCQPHSRAGQQGGSADDRDLWSEFRRIVEELRPRWVVVENTPGIRETILDAVLSDLENLGYTCGTVNIPACAFDTVHIRERTFVLANTHSEGIQENRLENRGQQTTLSAQRCVQAMEKFRQIQPTSIYNFSSRVGREGRAFSAEEVTKTYGNEGSGNPQSRLDRVHHGVSSRLDRRRMKRRLKMLGNAVYPPLIKFLGELILQTEEEFNNDPFRQYAK